MRLISIDPATRSGVAIWIAGKLHSCGVVHLGHWQDWIDTTERSFGIPIGSFEVVCEIQRNRYGRASVSSLLKLARITGTILGRFEARGIEPTLVAPSEWKRQVPKPRDGGTYLIDTRVRALLDDREFATYCAGLAAAGAGLLDVVDAVGIGLVYQKRALPGVV